MSKPDKNNRCAPGHPLIKRASHRYQDSATGACVARNAASTASRGPSACNTPLLSTITRSATAKMPGLCVTSTTVLPWALRICTARTRAASPTS